MPLAPDARQLLDRLAASGFRPVNETPLAEAREFRDRLALAGERPPVGRVEERTIPGADGELPVRLYTPSGEGPFPLLVYFHGGGWVVGSLETHDALCRVLAESGRCVVLSVAYRLAPECRFPGPLEDAYAAVCWAAELADGPIAVGGDSAGGTLAAGAAMLARDRGGPQIGFQLLLYPVVDTPCDNASYREYERGPFLTRAGMDFYWQQYGADPSDPLAAPLRGPDLSGLPPALVITAECDVLRDEGEAYAARLEEAVCIRYLGMFHAFMSYPQELAAARHALEMAGASVRRALLG